MVDTARRAVAELAASQHRTFTRRQAAELNFDYRRVATAKRDGWITEPVRGVLALADGKLTWEQRLHVVLHGAGGRGAVSHRSAARLHQFDGFDPSHNATVEISVPRDLRFRHCVNAVIHHITPFDPSDILVVSGFPCVRKERALAELGAVVPNAMVVRMALTSARRNGLDLPRTRDIAERLHRPGQAGTGILLRLLDGIPWEGQLPANWFEELLALCVTDPSLPEVKLQVPLGADRRGARRATGHRSGTVRLGAHLSGVVRHEAAGGGTRRREGSDRGTPAAVAERCGLMVGARDL